MFNRAVAFPDSRYKIHKKWDASIKGGYSELLHIVYLFGIFCRIWQAEKSGGFYLL